MAVIVYKCQGQKTTFGSWLSPSITVYRDQTQVLGHVPQLNHLAYTLLACLDISWQLPTSP